MNGYISIGNLAKELKTSNQKIGQLIKKQGYKVRKFYNPEKKSTEKTVTLKTADRIRMLLPSFEMQKHSRIKLKKEDVVTKFVKHEEDNDEQFKNPIISVDAKGKTSGMGIESIWAKQRCEILEG
jgi:hypothetical protein